MNHSISCLRFLVGVGLLGVLLTGCGSPPMTTSTTTETTRTTASPMMAPSTMPMSSSSTTSVTRTAP